MNKATLLLTLLSLFTIASAQSSLDKLTPSRERLVFQTRFGDIHMAFFPSVAPITVQHIRRLGELGCYTSNHFFRIDKGFVAQTADILGGRTIRLNDVQQAEANKHVPLEVRKDVKHDRRGVLSMARSSDPNSGGSSFSILLGPAPHLDMEYTIFGIVTKGIETLSGMEELETIREGIFVMPKERVEILSTYMYVTDSIGEDAASLGRDSRAFGYMSEVLSDLRRRYDAQAKKLQEERQKALPGS